MIYCSPNPTGYFWLPEPPLEPPDEPEPDAKNPPNLFQPVEDYTLAQWKEYCEEWDECPRNEDCAFYRLCAIWPCEWKLGGTA